MQLRLLDHRDSTAKVDFAILPLYPSTVCCYFTLLHFSCFPQLNCAAAVTAETSGEGTVSSLTSSTLSTATTITA